MGLYTGNSVWQNSVYEYDETDPVLGGPAGAANKPGHDLADRTVWLKDQIGRMNRFEGYVVFNTGGFIGNVRSGLVIVADVADISNFVLNPANTFLPGTIIQFLSFCTPGAVANILTTGTDTFLGQDEPTRLHMHNRESLMVVACNDHWKVIPMIGNFYCAGEEVKARKVLNNTLSLRGQLVSRDAYPRLFKFYQTLTDNQERVSESLWQIDPLTYRGCFSDGDGVSTFRLPDERGMHERMLDLGRGVDLSRTHNFAGGYEADEVKQHGHTLSTTNTPSSSNNFADPMRGQIGGSPNAKGAIGGGSIGLTGGPENTVKNIGKLHLIKY